MNLKVLVVGCGIGVSVLSWAVTRDEILVLKWVQSGSFESIVKAQELGIDLKKSFQVSGKETTALEYVLQGEGGFGVELPFDNVALLAQLMMEVEVPLTRRSISFFQKRFENDRSFWRNVLQQSNVRFASTLLRSVSVRARQFALLDLVRNRELLSQAFPSPEFRLILAAEAMVGSFQWMDKRTTFNEFVNGSEFPPLDGTMNCNQTLMAATYLASLCDRSELDTIFFTPVATLPQEDLLFKLQSGEMTISQAIARVGHRGVQKAVNHTMARNFGRNSSSLQQIETVKDVNEFLDASGASVAILYFPMGDLVTHYGLVYRLPGESEVYIIQLNSKEFGSGTVEREELGRFIQRGFSGYSNADISCYRLLSFPK